MLTFSYPEHPHPDIRAQFHAFFGSLRTVLPCAKCRQHFADHFDRTVDKGGDDPFSSRESLTRWLIDIHNDVNASQGKPRLPRDQARRLYLSKDLMCSDSIGSQDLSDSPPARGGGGRQRATWLYALLCLLLVCVGGLLAALVHRRCWA